MIRNRILLEILIFVELGFELALGHQGVFHQLYLKLLEILVGAEAYLVFELLYLCSQVLNVLTLDHADVIV